MHPVRPPAWIATLVGCLVLGTSVAQADYTLKTIADFNGTNGSFSSSGVIFDAQGNLYGTTTQGGVGGDGTVFKVAAGTGAINTLATFSGPNGDGPQGGLTFDAQGNLYGTTSRGGANGYGTVFEIAAGTGTLSTIASFNNTNGANPFSKLTIDGQGNLYGTTTAGGANNDGTVFKIAAGTGTISTVATFNGANGNDPSAGLTLDSRGNLFGTTLHGGTAGSNGTVFEIAAGTSSISTLANFTGANGSVLYGGVTLDAQGNIYSTTFAGGANNAGTIFKIDAGTGAVSTLASIAKGGSEAGLTIDAQGNLFGTTNGFPGADATVFEYSAATGTLSTLATLPGPSPNVPVFLYSGVTLDAAGNLYSVTFSGGANNRGMVFELANNAAVPEPASLIALGQAGLAGLVLMRRFRSRRAG